MEGIKFLKNIFTCYSEEGGLKQKGMGVGKEEKGK